MAIKLILFDNLSSDDKVDKFEFLVGLNNRLVFLDEKIVLLIKELFDFFLGEFIKYWIFPQIVNIAAWFLKNWIIFKLDTVFLNYELHLFEEQIINLPVQICLFQ